MRALFWLLFLAALAVGLSLAARYNAGYALFVLPPWRVEVSLNLLLMVQVAGFILLYLLLRLIANTLALPDKVRAYRARRAREKADDQLREATRLLQEGRYGHALKSAERAWLSGYAPGMAALVGLRAAHALRDFEREREWRDRARAQDGEVRAARLMTEAELALDARDFGAAREALDQLADEGGRHIAPLRLALRAHQAMGEWDEVLKLARHLEKHRALSAEQAAPLRTRAHRELIGEISDPAQLWRYWNDMSAADRLEPRLAAQAVRTLVSTGGCNDAATLIEDFLDERWDSSVVALYADCEGGDTLARIAHAEKWLTAHPRDEQLLLALGRLCRQQKLWGKAQSYLEASLAVKPTRGAHIELAQLLDRLERTEDANRHYRKAAIL
jgi:HemY protein